MGKCALFGDPHLISFDRVYGPPITVLVPGEYHLIKSGQLQVQARFGYTRQFPTAASTVGIAVGGSRIKGHTLAVVYVGPSPGIKGFKVFWDGKEILQHYPSTFVSPDLVLSAKYDAMDPEQYHREGRHTIGGTHGALPSFLFDLGDATGSFLTVYVLVGPDSVNAVVTTRKIEGGQDGLCGNFNCNQEDDSLEALERRGMAATVAPGQSLFRLAAAAPAWMMKHVAPPSLQECDPIVRAEAVKRCKWVTDGSEEACIFDACATHARHQPAGAGPIAAVHRLERKFEMGQAPQSSGAYQRHTPAGVVLTIVGACGLCAAIPVTMARAKSWYGYSIVAATPEKDGSPLLLTE